MNKNKTKRLAETDQDREVRSRYIPKPVFVSILFSFLKFSRIGAQEQGSTMIDIWSMENVRNYLKEILYTPEKITEICVLSKFQ